MKNLVISLKRILRKLGLLYFVKSFFFGVNPKYHFYRFKVFDIFLDSDGNEYEIYNGFRNLIYPNSDKKFENSSIGDHQIILNEKKIIEKYIQKKYIISKMNNSLQNFDIDFKNKTVLEVGCYLGEGLYHLCEIGCGNIVGSDFGKYYVVQSDKKEIGKRDIEIASKELIQKRLKVKECLLRRYKKLKNKFNEGKITFVEDDICNSNLKDNSFDIIYSFQVLEHINNPQNAFQEMFRLLKPSGVSYNTYTSFYHFKGGHSYCTLDFPWGHCRLSPQDFKRYLKKYRPDEYDIALRFYYQNLNRISIKQTLEIINIVGFKVLEFNKHRIHLPSKILKNKVLRDIQKRYPDVVLDDLTSSLELIIQK